ncbi:hypothetical protein RB2083_948 [Rhodobacteraceae bacterium HTCC2083]|nr:hypothetical protein RB2083_948 [Rhodobacteraceae bacterium HTCC2083]
MNIVSLLLRCQKRKLFGARIGLLEGKNEAKVRKFYALISQKT